MSFIPRQKIEILDALEKCSCVERGGWVMKSEGICICYTGIQEVWGIRKDKVPLQRVFSNNSQNG